MITKSDVINVRDGRVLDWLKAMGLDDHVTRVIIDLRYDGSDAVPRIYVERLGTDKLVFNPPTFKGAKITVVNGGEQ